MSTNPVEKELDSIEQNQAAMNQRLENSRNEGTPQIMPSLLSTLKGHASVSSRPANTQRVAREGSDATEYIEPRQHNNQYVPARTSQYGTTASRFDGTYQPSAGSVHPDGFGPQQPLPSSRGIARSLASARAGPPGSVGKLNTLFYAVLFQLWRCVERRKRSVKKEVFSRLISNVAKDHGVVYKARALEAALDKVRRQRLITAMGRWQWWLDPCWPLGPASDEYNVDHPPRKAKQDPRCIQKQVGARMLRLALKGVLDGQVQRALLQWRTACGGVGACRFKAGQVLQEDAPGIFDSEWARNGASKSFETVSEEEESQEVTESATDRHTELSRISDTLADMERELMSGRSRSVLEQSPSPARSPASII